MNVDITPGGKSVKKRAGYAAAYTLPITTSTVHGIYRFYDSSGNEIFLFFNDSYITSSYNGGTPVTLTRAGPNAASYQCVDYAGFAYCANSGRSAIYKTDGTTLSNLTGFTSTGTMVAVTPDRLVQSGFASAPNRIDFSASALFTSWSAPFLLSTDPNQITIVSPGSRITHIVYAFQRLMWFKDSSFGYILFDNNSLSNWQVRTVSPNVGTLDNSSIYWQDVLYFRGQDGHFYAYDGANLQRMSRDITTSIKQAQSRLSNSWTQTSQADWQAGSQSPSGWFDLVIATGSVVLATATAPSSLEDNSQAQFQGGTLTNLDSTTSPGDLTLAILNGNQSVSSNTSNDGSVVLCGSQFQAQQFYAGATAFVSTAAVYAYWITGAADLQVSILSDSSGSPGSTLTSGTISVASVPAGNSGSPIVATFSSPVTLTFGTSYWLQLTTPGSSCNVGSGWNWLIKSGSYAQTFSYNGATSTSSKAAYSITGKTYQTSGNIVSRTFDIGFSTSLWLWSSSFDAQRTTPTGTNITFQTQTSADGVTWDPLQTATVGSALLSTNREFYRYKATLTGTGPNTPTLSLVDINFGNRVRPAATFYSVVKSVPNLTNWDSFQATKQDNGGTHSFYIRAATNTFSILSSTPVWTTVTSGGIPSISTGTFFQIRDDFVALTSTASPNLDDFTQNWFEGSAVDKAYGAYFDNALWWDIQLGAGSSYNNRVFKYDLINQGWLIYDIPMNGMFVRSNSLYFGSSSAGYVYKYGDTNNDNGAAINAYWKSKDFFGDSPFTVKTITEISAAATSIQNSTVTITVTVDNRYSLTDTWSLYNPNSNFIKYNNSQPLTAAGTTFNFQFGNNAADQPFEWFAGAIGYRPKPLKDTRQ